MTAGDVLRPPDPAVDVPAPAPELPARRRTWWLHLLVLMATAVLGAGAAQTLQASTSAGLMGQIRDCSARTAERYRDDPNGDRALAAQLACIAPATHRSAVFGLAGGLALPATGWLLMLAGAAATRRSRTRSSVPADSDALRRARLRFDRCCDEAGLPSGLRPTLLIGPPTAQAHTVAIPLRRPVVVVPVDHVYAPGDWLDLVFLHELAHVRSRDGVWASAAWWAGQLVLPVVCIAIAPALLQATSPGAWASVAGTLFGSVPAAVAVLVFRATLLRTRERDADAFAVAVLARRPAPGPAPDTDADVARLPGTAVRGAPGRTGRLGQLRSWVTAPLAQHPPPGSRFGEAGAPVTTVLETAAVAAASGIVTLFGSQLLLVIGEGLATGDAAEGYLAAARRVRRAGEAVGNARGPHWAGSLSLPDTGVLDRNLLQLLVPVLLGVLLWAIVLAPLWSQDPPVWSGRSAGRRWWPVLASAAGMFVGALTRPPGALVNGLGELITGVLSAVTFLVVAVGASMLTAVLADAVPPGHGGRRAVALAVLVGCVTVTSALVLTTLLVAADLVGQAGQAGQAAVARFAAVFLADAVSGWVAPAALLAAVVVLLFLSRRPGPGGGWFPLLPAHWWAASVATAVGTGCGAITTSVMGHHLPTDDDVLLLGTRRWWICAVTGGVLLLVLLGSDRVTAVRRRAAAAVALSGLVTVVTGAGQYLVDLLVGQGGSGRGLGNLRGFVVVPAWLFLLLAVTVAAPSVMLAGLVRVRARRRGGPSPGSWLVVPVAGLLVLIMTVAVATGRAAAVTTAPGDAHTALRVLTGADPAARELTTAQAQAALRTVATRTLSGDWQEQAPLPRGVPDGLRPDSCRRHQQDTDAAEHGAPTSADVERRYVVGPDQMPPEGIGMDLSLTSYPDPAAARRMLDLWRQDGRLCDGFTVPGRSATGAAPETWTGHVSVDVDDVQAPAVVIERVVLHSDRPGAPVRYGLGALAVLGHNVIAVDAVYAVRPAGAGNADYFQSLTLDKLTSIIAEVHTALSATG